MSTTWQLTGIIPLFPNEAKAEDFNLAPNQILPRGTIMGELSGTNEVQIITLALATAGTFTLTFRGQTTGGIAYNAAASAVQTALLALSTIGGDNVIVSGGAGGPYTVTFNDHLGSQNVPQLTADATSLTGTNAVQSVTITGGPTGGTFTLTYGGQTTSPIPYNETAANVQTALRALSSITGTNVAVTGSAGGPYTVTFQGTLGQQAIVLMTASGAGLTGGTAPAVAVASVTTGGPATVTPATQTPGSAGSQGVLAAYNANNTDGTQIPKGVLQFDCAVDSAGLITLGDQTGGGDHQETVIATPMFFCGTFKISDLHGLDSNALTVTGWRLIEGTITSGIVRMA